MTAPFDFAQGDTLINYGNSVLAVSASSSTELAEASPRAATKKD